MNRNFSIADAVAIQVDGSYSDLHNDFDLCELTVNFLERLVRLRFDRTRNAGPSPNVRRLVLEFVEVDYLDVSPGVLRMMTCYFNEVGYKSPQDFDHDWLMPESQSGIADHIFLRLSGDEFIRLHSNKAIATMYPPLDLQ